MNRATLGQQSETPEPTCNSKTSLTPCSEITRHSVTLISSEVVQVLTESTTWEQTKELLLPSLNFRTLLILTIWELIHSMECTLDNSKTSLTPCSEITRHSVTQISSEVVQVLTESTTWEQTQELSQPSLNSKTLLTRLMLPMLEVLPTSMETVLEATMSESSTEEEMES